MNIFLTGAVISATALPLPSEEKDMRQKCSALALGKCRELGLDKVLISCDKSNTASAKTITNNGGVLENEVTEDDGNVFQRYWIDLLRPEDKLKATAFISLLRGINVGGNKKNRHERIDRSI